jgi:hypothetical protein
MSYSNDRAGRATVPQLKLHTVTGASYFGQAVGLKVGTFNPALDEDGALARRLVSCLVAGRLRRGRSLDVTSPLFNAPVGTA